MKKVLTWLVLAFVIFWLISAPQDAADVTRSAAHGLSAAGQSLMTFFGSLGQ